MGIREEIEKLRAPSVPDNYGGGEDAARIYQLFKDSGDETIDDVLSILDEHLGECVTEYEFERVGVLRLVLRGETKRLIGGLTGDRISIFKRKKP